MISNLAPVYSTVSCHAWTGGRVQIGVEMHTLAPPINTPYVSLTLSDWHVGCVVSPHRAAIRPAQSSKLMKDTRSCGCDIVLDLPKLVNAMLLQSTVIVPIRGLMKWWPETMHPTILQVSSITTHLASGVRRCKDVHNDTSLDPRRCGPCPCAKRGGTAVIAIRFECAADRTERRIHDARWQGKATTPSSRPRSGHPVRGGVSRESQPLSSALPPLSRPSPSCARLGRGCCRGGQAGVPPGAAAATRAKHPHHRGPAVQRSPPCGGVAAVAVCSQAAHVERLCWCRRTGPVRGRRPRAPAYTTATVRVASRWPNGGRVGH